MSYIIMVIVEHREETLEQVLASVRAHKRLGHRVTSVVEVKPDGSNAIYDVIDGGLEGVELTPVKNQSS